MKTLKKIQLKTFVLWITLFVWAISIFAGVGVLSAAAATENSTEITYVDTEVKRIAFQQHPDHVYFGFELSESDYDDFGNWEGDFYSTDAHYRYEAYLAGVETPLTYWKNFSKMNSEGAAFDQLYGYWNAGLNPSTGSYALPFGSFQNTLAHRTNLARLEYGLVISIPAGTTFPSAAYIKGGCQSETNVIYRTTTDVAFYYDGDRFQIFHYAISEERKAAIEAVNSIDLTVYGATERAEVEALIADANKVLKESFTSIAIQDAVVSFNERLATIMTIADHEAVAQEKTAAKAELSSFFANGYKQADYDVAEWNTLLTMQGEYPALIDGCTRIEEISAVVSGVKLAADKILTTAEKAGFATYKADAIARVEGAFDKTLYRAEEKIQGEALVAEAKSLIENATTYDEVDGVAFTYVKRIGELKTKTELDEEDKVVDSEIVDSTEEDSTASNETASNSGCGSSLSQFGTIFGMAAMAMLTVINKKRKD